MPCRWKGAHRLKAWSGVAAGLLGWVALGLAFLAPLGYYTSSSTVCADSCLTTREAGPENLAALAMPAVAWGVFLELLSFCLLGVVVSAVLHAQTGARGWYRLLWGSTLLLVGLIAWMCIGFPAYSVGLLLAPAGGLALLVVWTAWRSQPQPPTLPALPLLPGEHQSKRQGLAGGVELLSGLAAGFLGLENLGIVLFAPLSNESTGSTSCIARVCTTVDVWSKVNSLERGAIAPDGLFPLVLVSLCLLGVALSAVLERHTQDGNWLAILWICTLLLVIMSVLLFSLVFVLLPAVVLALVAVCASFVRGTPTQPM